MRKLLIAVVLAVVASCAFTSVASAHRLSYSTAKKLAVKLANQEVRNASAKGDPVESWRIFGAERLSDHKLVWFYNVDYASGRLCDAEILVRITRNSAGRPIRKATFEDTQCE